MNPYDVLFILYQIFIFGMAATLPLLGLIFLSRLVIRATGYRRRTSH